MNVIDQLNMVTAQQSQQVAFALLDSMQGIQPKGLQLSGTAMMFLLMCEQSKIDPRQVLDKASRVLHDTFTEGTGGYVKAIQQYLKEEL
jgi:hypothetical protein